MENVFEVMENKFEIIVIKPNMIEHLDYNRVDYVSDIINHDCYVNKSTNSEDIGIIFAEYLNTENYLGCNALTNKCYETSEYLYEICFMDIPHDKKNNSTYNQIATILDVTSEHIFGNAILLKTYLPLKTMDMKLVSVKKDDIKEILNARVNHQGVFIDTDSNLKQITFRDIKSKLNELLDEDIKNLAKIEIPFLKHNFIMFYCKDSLDQENILVKDVAQKKVYGDVFIVSMLTDSIYTNILVDEVKKILAISKLGEKAWLSKSEYDDIDKDELGRTLIKSKYRILDKKFCEISNLD